MESLIPLIIFWLLMAFIGNAAKKKKAAQQQKAQPQKAQPQKTQQNPQQNAAAGQARAKAPAPAPQQPKPVSEHKTAPFETHMHAPVMGIEGVGNEGEDCCHDFMLEGPREEAAPDFQPMTEEDAEKSRMLLQGVIFSEILGRRPVRRFGGRRA